MSFLLISVLLEPRIPAAEVGMTPEVGVIVTVVALTGSVATAGCEFVKKLNFIVKQ